MNHPLDFICFSLNIDHSLYSQASWGFRDNISGLQEAQCQVESLICRWAVLAYGTGSAKMHRLG